MQKTSLGYRKVESLTVPLSPAQGSPTPVRSMMADVVPTKADRVQAIEGIEHSLAQTTPQGSEAAAALSKMQKELSSENATKDSSPGLSAQVAAQLHADGFSNVAVDKNGDLVFNQPSEVSTQSTSDKTTTPASTAASGESDFVNFAALLSKVQSGQKVEAKDFSTVFGAQDAALLQSMGLQDISNSNGHFQADFSQPGSMAFGANKLEYQKTASFDLTANSQGVELSNIQGLKGTDGGLNPTVTKIAISPEDLQTRQTKVVVTGKEAFISANQTFEIPSGDA